MSPPCGLPDEQMPRRRGTEPEHMRYFLGIDGGGSRTTAWLAEDCGIDHHHLQSPSAKVRELALTQQPGTLPRDLCVWAGR